MEVLGSRELQLLLLLCARQWPPASRGAGRQGGRKLGVLNYELCQAGSQGCCNSRGAPHETRAERSSLSIYCVRVGQGNGPVAARSERRRGSVKAKPKRIAYRDHTYMTCVPPIMCNRAKQLLVRHGMYWVRPNSARTLSHSSLSQLTYVEGVGPYVASFDSPTDNSKI